MLRRPRTQCSLLLTSNFIGPQFPLGISKMKINNINSNEKILSASSSPFKHSVIWNSLIAAPNWFHQVRTCSSTSESSVTSVGQPAVVAEPVHHADYLNKELIVFVMREVTNKPELSKLFADAETKIFEGLEQQQSSSNKYSTLLSQLDGSVAPSNEFARKLTSDEDTGTRSFCMLVLQQLQAHSTEQSPISFCAMTFVCSFATNEQKITKKTFIPAKVLLSAPCRKVRLIFDAFLFPFLAHQKKEFSELITSTIDKAADIENEKIESLPAIVRRIQARHKAQRDGVKTKTDQDPQKSENQNINPHIINQQFKFVAESHASLCCTNDCLEVATDRFINSYSGAPIQNCFVSPESSRVKQFTSDQVNIVTGASGAGKTISSLTAGSTKDAPVCSLLIHAGPDCLGGSTDLPCVSDQDESSVALKSDRDDGALHGLLKGILTALDIGIPIFSREASTDSKNNEMFDILRQNFKPSSNEKKLNFPFIIRIIIDEIGMFPALLRSFCRIWKSARKMLADCFGMPLLNLQFVAVGAGADNFELNKIGSIAGTFQVLVVARDNSVFKKLFHQQIASAKSIASLQVYSMLFGENPPSQIGRSLRVVKLAANPVFDAMRRMCSNVRCGCIFLSLMHDTFEENLLQNPEKQTLQFSSLAPDTYPHTEQWAPEQLHALVAHWCVLAVAMFCSRNGLKKLPSLEARFHALGKAISFSLNRVTTLDQHTWNQYAAEYGLLTDAAVHERDSLADKSKYELDPVFENTVDNVKQKYFILVDTSRFCVNDAMVTMYRLLSQSLSDGVFAKNYTNVDLLFEEALVDFARVAAQFGKRADSSSVVPSSEGFTSPRHLFGMNCETVTSAQLSFQLCERMFDGYSLEKKDKSSSGAKPETLAVLERSFTLWNKLVAEEGSAVTFLNGDGAPSAGFIVLGPNRIIMVQAKNGGKGSIDSEKIDEELQKMRGRRLLEVLSWCVYQEGNQNNNNEIDVFYVIAGGNKDAFAQGEKKSPTKYFAPKTDRNEVFENGFRRKVVEALDNVTMKTHGDVRTKLIAQMKEDLSDVLMQNGKLIQKTDQQKRNDVRSVRDTLLAVLTDPNNHFSNRNLTMADLIEDISTSKDSGKLAQNRLRTLAWKMGKGTTKLPATATTTTTTTLTELDVSSSWSRIWKATSSPHKTEKYHLRESIHFTFANPDGTGGLSPLYPILQSKLPVASNVVDQYVTRTIVGAGKEAGITIATQETKLADAVLAVAGNLEIEILQGA